MAYDAILPGEIEAGDVTDETLWEKVRNNQNYLNGQLGGIGATDVPNGDMELDSEGTGIPDRWTDDGTAVPIYGGHGDVYPGGSIAFETTSPLNGSQSIKMVHPGGASNGGGLLESDFISCGAEAPFRLTWLHYATAAGMKNQVVVYWYDEDQVILGGTPSTVLYSSTTNPTAVKQFWGLATPPATAKFYTIGLVGGFTDTDVAGTAYFDSVHVEPDRIRTYDLSGGSIATVEITDLNYSRRLRVTGSGLQGSASTTLVIVASTDNGATWVTSSIYYIGAAGFSGTPLTFAANLATLININTGGTAQTHCEITLENLGKARDTYVEGTELYNTPGTSTFHSKIYGLINSRTAYNAIKIYPLSGTFSAGEFIVEEVD